MTSPPVYRNYNLEQIIANAKHSVHVGLGWKELTDQDMEIVAYYVLRSSMVSQMIFVHTFGEIRNIHTCKFFGKTIYTINVCIHPSSDGRACEKFFCILIKLRN